MNRRPHRLAAALTTALMGFQLGCAHQQVTVSPQGLDEVLPCRTYGNALQEQPSKGSGGVLIAALGSAGLLIAGLAVASQQPSCTQVFCGMDQKLGGGALALAGLVGLGVTAAVGLSSIDGRPASAARCDGVLVRVCAGQEDDASCRAALEKACAGADREACWALAPPAKGEAPVAAPAAPACREDVYPHVPCER